jgi:hypothetical protein
MDGQFLPGLQGCGGQGRISSQSELRRTKCARRVRIDIQSIRINRTTDTRIFRTVGVLFSTYLSTSYRGVRCQQVITVHNDG